MSDIIVDVKNDTTAGDTFMYPIIDISGWRHEDIAVSGTKEKRWYRSSTDSSLVLFKLPVSITSPTSNLSNGMTGEMWSEKISSEIGKIIGYDVHQVEIGCIELSNEVISYYGLRPDIIKSDIIYGALCHSFLKEGEESLVEGADMIMEFDFTYDRKKLRGEKEIYNYDLLLRLFERYNFLNELFKMIVFDTLIGNTDRHQDNFGIIRNEKLNNLKFAPLYDNSSSLGRELPLTKVSQMLIDQAMFNAYLHGKRSSTPIKWGTYESYERVNLFDFLKRALLLTPSIKDHVASLEILTDTKITDVINNIPEEVITSTQRELIIKLLKARRDYMLGELL